METPQEYKDRVEKFCLLSLKEYSNYFDNQLKECRTFDQIKFVFDSSVTYLMSTLYYVIDSSISKDMGEFYFDGAIETLQRCKNSFIDRCEEDGR